MKFSITDNSKKDLFVAIVALLKNSTGLLNLMFNDDYLYIQGMDKSHVSLFDIKLMKSWFSEYEKDKNDKCEIFVVPQILFTIISSASNEHDIYFEFSGNPENLDINLITKKTAKGEFSNYFRIPLVDSDVELLNVPEMDYDVEFSVNAKSLVKSLIRWLILVILLTLNALNRVLL